MNFFMPFIISKYYKKIDFYYAEIREFRMTSETTIYKKKQAPKGAC